MRRLAAVLILVVLASASAARAEERALRFERAGAAARTLPLAELERACGPRKVTVPRDPYYGREKRFRALPLACVLEQGLGALPVADASVFFRAKDGYVKPAQGALLRQPGGWLAFADAEHASGDDPGWQPIDRRQVDPGPFYVVWTGEEQGDPHFHPWPYQLVAVEQAPFASRYPHTEPVGSPEGSPARRGYRIFASECVACHAVNGEGGRVGPELNVPRSIVEYRPAEQIKAYVRDPSSFRYTSMPANPHLSDVELDALVAYFRAMSALKHDPRAR